MIHNNGCLSLCLGVRPLLGLPAAHLFTEPLCCRELTSLPGVVHGGTQSALTSSVFCTSSAETLPLLQAHMKTNTVLSVSSLLNID